jgi:hypothetical protein
MNQRNNQGCVDGRGHVKKETTMPHKPSENEGANSYEPPLFRWKRIIQGPVPPVHPPYEIASRNQGCRLR